MILPMLLAGTLCLPLSAQQLYIRNRPFAGQTAKQGSSFLLELEKVAAALELKVTKNEDGSYTLGEGGTPSGAGKVSVGGEIIDFQDRDGVPFVLLDDLVKPCGLRITRNTALNSIDVALLGKTTAPSAAEAAEAAEATAETGSTGSTGHSKTWNNPGLGFSIDVPEGYMVVDNPNVLKKVQDAGMEHVGTAQAQQIMKTASVGMQVSVLCSNGTHKGCNLTLVTEALSSSQVGTQAYAAMNKANMPMLIKGAKVQDGSPATRLIDGVEFAVLDCTVPTEGKKMRCRMFVAVDSQRSLGYAIGLTGKTEADMRELEKLLLGIHLKLRAGGSV